METPNDPTENIDENADVEGDAGNIDELTVPESTDEP